jgi:hypothetical protein
MTPPDIQIEATPRQFASWRGIAILGHELGPTGWALAGGQMVAVLLAEADLPFPRITVDADAVIDVRARPDGTRRVAAALLAAGWDAVGVDDLLHRFTSAEGGTIDLLGPDGLRSRPVTVPPRRTLLAPGGTQLLHRSSPVGAVVRSPEGASVELTLAMPSRLGALIAKSAAIALPEGSDRHLLDAVHLAACLRPGDLDEPLGRSDLRRLRTLLLRGPSVLQRGTVDDRILVLANASLERLAARIAQGS